MCRPQYFDVCYEINAWMQTTNRPTSPVAMAQWEKLQQTLASCGVQIELLEQDPAQPDMVFTANGALIRGKLAVLPRFKFKERQAEVKGFKAFLEKRGFTLFEPLNYFFEGEGDALFAGETLFCGYGFRSERDVYAEVVASLEVRSSVLCELVDPRFYHLDTCFCPLNAKQALFFPDAFSAESRRRLESSIELIPVSLEDALCFVCNTVVVGKSLVMPAGASATVARVEALGFTVYQVEMDQFIKGGGAAKCCCLWLERAQD